MHIIAAHARRAVRFFIRCVCAVLLLLPGVALADTDAATVYLKAHAQNPWVTMALAAQGESPDVSYLQTATGTAAIDIEAPILALTAAGKSPYTYPSSNLVAGLEAYYSNGQLGDPLLINDDIFGILALVSASVAADDPVVAGTKAFVLANQNADGGWPYNTGGTSDTNTTAAAIMALVAAGDSAGSAPIAHALSYLHTAQNSDGGFPYDPKSSWGTASDASSDAWVMMALVAAGVDPSSWMASSTPANNILSMQTTSTTSPAGYFEYQPGSGEDSFTPVTTAYAVLALLGKTLPVATFTPPPPPPPPTPAPSGGGGGGGGPVSGPMSFGYQVLEATSSSATSTGAGALLPEVLGTSTSMLSDTANEAATTTQDATSTPAAVPGLFAGNLHYGMRGVEVSALQEVLIAGRFLQIASSTGWFGPLTLAAVERYQSVWGIMPTGFVGPVTRAWLNVRAQELLVQ